MGGGGVGVYVRDDFAVEILATSEPLFDNKPEYFSKSPPLEPESYLLQSIAVPTPTILTNFYLFSQPTSPISTL